MCQANLDTRQTEISKKMGRPINIPILYFSQVIGYALGLGSAELGLKKHIINPIPLMVDKCSRRHREASA